MFAFFFIVLALVAMTTVGSHSRSHESVSGNLRHAGQGLSTVEMTRQANIALPLR